MTKMIPQSTVCFWTDPADEVQALLQFLNTGVIRKIIPRQPLRAKEVGVFLFTIIITWGRVVFSVDPSAQWITSKKSFQSKRQWWFRIIIKTGSHYQIHQWKAQKGKTYKGDLQNWGIPLTVIPKKKETVQAKKKGITKIRQERGHTNPQQKQKWLPIQNKLSTSESSPENQSKDSNKV